MREKGTKGEWAGQHHYFSSLHLSTVILPGSSVLIFSFFRHPFDKCVYKLPFKQIELYFISAYKTVNAPLHSPVCSETFSLESP